MDFGIMRLHAGETFDLNDQEEKAVLLMTGVVKFTWHDENGDLEVGKAERSSIFDEAPWCLHVPSQIGITIEATNESELAIIKTFNDQQFQPRLHAAAECQDERRGEGTMRETSTRIVRTIFDYSTAPDANLVLGEVITFPGKWSSYPPHYHPQPEIYHYRFLPEQGFGVGVLGEEAVKIEHCDTVTIFNFTHAQAAAPGYAMYYIWAIRHLDGNPYIKPVFEEKHLWVTDKDNEAKIWPLDSN